MSEGPKKHAKSSGEATRGHYARRNERMAMKAKVSTGVVSVLMMLLFLVPVDARGAGHGMGMHAFHAGGHFAPHHFGHFARHHFARHHFFRNRQDIGGWPWGYGYYDGPPYAYDDYSTPQAVVAPQPEPPRAACQHSEQTVTVPSANGGTADVSILRC